MPFWVIAGGLAAIFIAIIIISPAFVEGAPLTARSAFGFTGLMITAGLAFLVLPGAIRNAVFNRRALTIALLLGVLFRLGFLTSTPVYEDDWRRYLWDGAVTLEGVSPYRYSPAEVAMAPEDTSDAALNRLKALDATQDEWPELVNYPYVTTIYPPVAQAAMAVSAGIAPFNLDAWRIVLFLFDAAGLAILLALLRSLKRSPLFALLYWWNPLLIVTTYNAAHMDILLAPFLLGAISMVIKNRPAFAGAALAGAVGVKLWPVLLAPALFIGWLKAPRKFLIASGVFIVLSVAITAPMLTMLGETRSGLAAYSSSWQTFSFLFTALKEGLFAFTDNADSIARAMSGLAIISASLGAALYVRQLPEKLPIALSCVVAVLLFASPTGYPWYVTWLIILLPLAPSIGFATLTATVPLYYLRYYLDAYDYLFLLDYIVTPAAFAIPLLALAIEWRWHHARHK